MAPLTISTTFRLALAGKGAVLAALGTFFGWLGLEFLARAAWPLVARGAGAVVAALATAFLVWAAGLAWLDVVTGLAVRSKGARALESRRAGYSLQLPSGRFVEFIFHNSWTPLQPGARYTVTYGRFSHVLVEAPQQEPEVPC